MVRNEIRGMVLLAALAVSAPAAALDWASPEHGLTVRLPGEWDPVPAEQLPPGAVLGVRQRDGVVMVQVRVVENEHDVTADELAMTVAQGGGLPADTSISEVRRVQQQHLPAVEYRARTEAGGRKATAWTRMVPAHEKLYQLAVVWPTELTPEPPAAALLDGMRLDPGIEPPTPPTSRAHYLRQLIGPGLVAAVVAVLALEARRRRRAMIREAAERARG